MRKLFLISLICGAASFASAMPGTGGYFGHRLIVGASGAYAPFYSSFGDLFSHADLQYGFELGAIVGRRVQVDLFYHTYALSGNDRYNDHDFGSKDRIFGSQIGMSYRKFIGKSGGLAPIGRFVDFTVAYSTNSLHEGSDNPYVVNNDLLHLPGPVDMITPSVAFGRQTLVCKRIMLTSGFRFGKDIQISGTSSNPMTARLNYKDYFSAFGGIGILL